MNNKCMMTTIITVLSLGILAGCGQNNTAVESEEPKPIIVEEAVEETVEEPVEEVAETEEPSVATPFLEDLEKYDSIVSTLTTNQYYAFASVGDGYDVLLVADEAFENGDGNMVAIDAVVYGIDNGTPCYAGAVWSDDAAYPIAVYDDLLIFGGSHRMTTANVIHAAVYVQKEAYEEVDEQGNTVYRLNEGDIDNIKTLEDESVLTEMFQTYDQAIALNFFQGEAEISK